MVRRRPLPKRGGKREREREGARSPEEARACAGGGAGGGGVTRATSHRRTLDCNPRHIENLGQKVTPVHTHAHVSRY